MLDVDTLSLTLPAGLRPRAARIARLLGEQLALHALPEQAGRIDTLALPPVRVDANWSDRRIASQLATQLAGRIAAAATGGDSC